MFAITSDSSDHSIYMYDYGRYKRQRLSPQVAEAQSTLQPVMTREQKPIKQMDNAVQQLKN